MFSAKVFKTGEVVLAQEVFDGKYDRNEDFVDVEEEFTVRYWKGAKNNGKPHFKLYLSKEDYKRFTPEQISRFKLLDKLRHYEDSEWHRNWEKQFEPFCKVEKHIKNPHTGKYRIADALYEEAKTEIEFQHSYIANDFEERNAFYDELGITTIWLYDLTDKNIVPKDDGFYSVTEDNSKGFFRIAEKPENLSNRNIFIQSKDKLIYRVDKLDRKTIDSDLKSTIRLFYPLGIYTPEEFVSMIRNRQFSLIKPNERYKSIWELWQPDYYWMAVENTENHDQIIIFKDPDKEGQMRTGPNYKTLVQYQYITFRDNKYNLTSKKTYNLSDARANKKVWILLRGFTDYYANTSER